jgi:hypothetical protein
MAKTLFIIACALAFLAPLFLTGATSSDAPTATFRGFPSDFEGVKLRELGLSERENYFLEDFPGKIGRFTDGRREIIIRWVTQATRKLHPAKDCFEAIGYETAPLPVKIDHRGKRWACFSARKNTESLRVCENIGDDAGNEWTDVSVWYWSVFSQQKGEWWAYTVAERE